MGAKMTVVQTSRSVIEHKLLTALNDESKVAILATQQDLQDLIVACEHNQFKYDLRKRCKELAEGMRMLLKEAFPINTKP